MRLERLAPKTAVPHRHGDGQHGAEVGSPDRDVGAESAPLQRIATPMSVLGGCAGGGEMHDHGRRMGRPAPRLSRTPERGSPARGPQAEGNDDNHDRKRPEQEDERVERDPGGRFSQAGLTRRGPTGDSAVARITAPTAPTSPTSRFRATPSMTSCRLPAPSGAQGGVAHALGARLAGQRLADDARVRRVQPTRRGCTSRRLVDGSMPRRMRPSPSLFPTPSTRRVPSALPRCRSEADPRHRAASARRTRRLWPCVGSPCG